MLVMGKEISGVCCVTEIALVGADVSEEMFSKEELETVIFGCLFIIKKFRERRYNFGVRSGFMKIRENERKKRENIELRN